MKLSLGCRVAVFRCGEAVWRVWGCYLEGVGRLSGGVGRLYDWCGEAVLRVWRDF